MINLIVDKENFKVGISRMTDEHTDFSNCEYVKENCDLRKENDVYNLMQNGRTIAFYPVAHTVVLFIKN